MSENGQSEQPPTVDQVVITRDRATGAVSLGGNVVGLDLILDMLGRATRHADVQFRIMAAVTAQEDIKRKKEEFARVQSLMSNLRS